MNVSIRVIVKQLVLSIILCQISIADMKRWISDGYILKNFEGVRSPLFIAS